MGSRTVRAPWGRGTTGSRRKFRPRTPPTAHRGVGLDMPAEHEQRRIHVRHAGQVAGVHRGVQRGHKLRRVQRDPVVPGMEKVVHFADVGCIRAGLKFCRVEVLFVITVAHRERLQLVALRRKMRIGNGRDQAGIQPAGQKRCHGHVGHELPLDSIGDEVAHLRAVAAKSSGWSWSSSRQ